MRIVDRFRKGEPVVINGSGKQTRDYVYVSDVVRANRMAAENSQAVGKSFNIGTGTATSVIDIVESLKILLNRKDHPVVHGPDVVEEVEDSYSDISLARDVLGYKPEVTLAEGLRRLVDWLGSRARI
jgi:nucleoside-diphosphate-sugar epimerase